MVKIWYGLVLLTLLSLLSGAVSASDFGKMNQNLEIKHKVTVQDYPVTNALCNITVRDPNDNTLVDFEAMENNSIENTYNYTLPASNTSLFGEYCYDVSCNHPSTGENQTKNFCVFLNPAGQELTNGEGILYLVSVIVLLLLFGLSLWGFIKTPFGNNRNSFGNIVGINHRKHLKLMLLGSTWIILIGLLYMMYNLTLGFFQLQAIGDFFFFLFRTSYVTFYVAFFLIIIIGTVIFIRDLRIDKKIREGKLLPKFDEF